MKQVEFGKEIQRLNKKLFDKVGENLNLSINLDNGEIKSCVYCGKDYPTDRKDLIDFLENKIDLYISKNEYNDRVDNDLVYLCFNGKGWTNLAIKIAGEQKQENLLDLIVPKNKEKPRIKHVRDGGNLTCKWFDSLPFLLVNLLINHYLEPSKLNFVNILQEPGNIQLSIINDDVYVTEFFDDDYRQITDINDLKTFSFKAAASVTDFAKTIIRDIEEQKELFLLRDGEETVRVVFDKALPALKSLMKKSKLTKEEKFVVDDFINNYRRSNEFYKPNYDLLKQKFIGKNVTVYITQAIGTENKIEKLVYPVNFGYVTTSSVGDVDAYVLGEFQPLKEFNGVVIAVIIRPLDERLVVVKNGKNYTTDQIKALTEFLENGHKIEIIR